MHRCGDLELLGQIKTHVLLRSDVFEGNVHQADQIQAAELTRQALQSVLLSGAVRVEATLSHQSDLETDLLDFVTTHLLEFLKTIE